MLVIALWLWALCSLVHAVNETSCKPDYRHIDSDETINITACTVIPCITKCCPANQALLYHEAHDTINCFDNINLTLTFNATNLDDYSEVPIYGKHVKRNVIKTMKKIDNFTIIYSENVFTSSICSIDIEESVPPKPLTYKYILENGYLVMRKLNYYNQWVSETAPGEFCVEHQIVLDANGVVSKPQLVIRTLTDNDEEEAEEEPKDAILANGMVISCVFLVLVLAAYALLPEMRNLAGLMLMAYVATLFSAFLFRIVQVFASERGPLEKTTCIWLGFIAYYTAVACFTWMNVMSFDIWWAMRGFRKLRRIHRRGVLVKLCWYGLYGWGAPLLLVIFMIVVENIDMTHLPDFVTPHYSDPDTCFMEEDERQLYMNGPILITLCINITLFLLTAYNIWRIKRGVSQHSARDSRRNKSDEARFGLYLKIALVMGINWILEIVSSLYEPDSKWWYIPDIFNSFIGIVIFIIFICKRNVIVLLCKRFSIGDNLRKWQPVDSKCFENSRVNSRRKILDSVTETSDVDDLGKSPSNQLVSEFQTNFKPYTDIAILE